jgi:hypothetical protein
VISEHGVSPDPEKIRVVQQTATPKNIAELQTFLGLANYYRRFVRRFADIAEPLHRLMKKGTPFVWNEASTIAFNKIKEALTSAPLLAFSHFDKPFVVYTDASNVGIGATLAQHIDGSEHVTAYTSRTLNTPERNYSTTERECLAVVEAVKQFRPYLYGRHFTIVVDHHSLRWLMNIKEPSSRLTRWSLRLQEYDFEIFYRPGSKHTNADALSRPPIVSSPNTSSTVLLVDPGSIAAVQRDDPELKNSLHF